MDREQLVEKLQPFIEKCAEEGYPLARMVLDEAYPGVIPTSFIVKVVAKGRLKGMPCSEALHILIDILWRTTEPETREDVFTIAVYDEHEALHCWNENTDAERLHALHNKVSKVYELS